MNRPEEKPTERMAESDLHTAIENDDAYATNATATTEDSSEEHLDGKDARRRLRELLARTKVIFVTTLGPDSLIRSRPMTLLELDDDARLWSFVDSRAAWVRELQGNPGQVNASASDEATSTMISIAGPASIVRDGIRAERLWNSGASAFFNGPCDLSLRLLCIESHIVEYWDRPGGTLGRMLATAKAAITGEHLPVHGSKGTLEIGSPRA